LSFAGDDPTTVDQYRALIGAIADIDQVVDEVEESYNGAAAISRRANEQIEEAERVLDGFDTTLDATEQVLEGEGLDTLQGIINTQETAGQQSEQLTEIAREARQLADE
jgi:laminin, gamma 1